MTKIPVNEALPLVRDFGLLINQAAIYGVTHRVIQGQAVAFFTRLHALAKTHETVEFSIKGDKLAVNGEIEGMDIMSTRNLKERMVLHKLPGIFFSAQLSQEEFLSFISNLAKSPGRVHEMGGFEQVLKNANMKGVSLVHFVYERVDTATAKEAPPPPPETQDKKPPAKQQPRSEPNSTYEIVLEEELDEVADEGISEKEVTGQASRERKKIQVELDSLINEVTLLFAQEGGPQNTQMVDKLRSIRDTLRTSTETSRERIATFLEPAIEPDLSAPMDSVQKDKVLNLRHSEYMQRFAELTQEIAQPLTITNSVIELLGKGQAGPLTESQSNFLALALESVDRVNQLIKYMHTLYGEPDSYTPDASIIQETYK
jgi:hypothetical protein